MTKYHINAKGVPAICRATKGNCPFGGDDSHFESKTQAQEAADKANSEQFGTLAISENKKQFKDVINFKAIQSKIEDSEVLKNLNNYDSLDRKKIAMNEINNIVADAMREQNIAEEIKETRSDNYKTFIRKRKGDVSPWAFLKKYTDERVDKVMNVVSPKPQKILEDDTKDLSAFKDKIEGDGLLSAENQLYVALENKEIGKREDKKWRQEGIKEEISSHAMNLAETWNELNKTIANSNVDWSPLSELKRENSEGWLTVYKTFNDHRNVENIKGKVTFDRDNYNW